MDAALAHYLSHGHLTPRLFLAKLTNVHLNGC